MNFNWLVRILVIFCFLCSNLNSQNLNIDSCLTVLKNAKEDTNKVILLDKVAWSISYKNLKTGIEYSEKSLTLAKALNYERFYANIYNTQGAIYTDLGELNKALKLFLEGLENTRKYHNYYMEARLLSSLGNLYNEQKENRTALSYYLQSIDLNKKTDIGDIIYIAQSNVAYTYIQFSQYDSAKYYINACINYNIKHKKKFNLINNFILLSEIFFYKNDKLQCLFSANEAVKLALKSNDDYTLSHAYFQLGRGHLINSNYSESINNINESINRAKKTGDIQILESDYEILSLVYEKTKDFKNGLLAYKQYVILKDSSLNIASIQQIKKSEAKYQNEKKQKEIELLGEKQKVNEVENQKKKLYLYIALSGIIILIVVLSLLFRNNKSKQKINKKLETFNKEINFQKELVEHKNKEVIDSIMYAQRIQQSILTSDNYFKKNTNDYFILFKPKDIVSGDFYWALNHNKKFILMNADCTGHGVPGAMMSMMGINFLNEIVNEKMIEKPSEILNQLRKDIIKTLNPEDSTDERKDGMDCSLLSIDYNAMRVTYSTANNSFYIIRNNELIVSNTNKMPVGIGHGDIDNFKDWTFDLQKNDIIITLTDGYADQFGGPKGKKFKYKPLENLLLTNAHLPLSEIKNKLSECLDTWKGDLEQVDDICIVGIKI